MYNTWPIKISCLTNKSNIAIRTKELANKISIKGNKKDKKRRNKTKRTNSNNKVMPIQTQTSLKKYFDTAHIDINIDELPVMSGKTNTSTMRAAHNPSTGAGSAPGENNREDTPIKPKDSGYRLRNHSYQQSVAPAITTIAEENSVQSSGSVESETDEMGSIENLLPPKVLIKREDFDKKTNPNKLDTIVEAVNKLHTRHLQTTARIKDLEFAVFDEQDGILPQLKTLAEFSKGQDDKMSIVSAEVIALREELEISKGLIQKQSKQIAALKNRQIDLTARSMADNITITGIKGDTKDKDQNCIPLLLNFFEEEMQIDLDEEEEIRVAHRIGQFAKGSHRPIVFRCPASLKKRIFENTRKLAGKPFSINQQLPDALVENKREIRQRIKERQKLEEGLEGNQKSTFNVRNAKLYINGHLQKKMLLPPAPAQLFVSKDEIDKMNSLDIQYTTSKPMKNCDFQAAACIVNNMNEVHLAYKRLFREFPAADHIAAAFDCQGESGYQDDSEYGSGYRLLNSIRDTKVGNLAVFVIRFYGGEHLGPARFTAIKDLAVEALQKIV